MCSSDLAVEPRFTRRKAALLVICGFFAAFAFLTKGFLAFVVPALAVTVSGSSGARKNVISAASNPCASFANSIPHPDNPAGASTACVCIQTQSPPKPRKNDASASFHRSAIGRFASAAIPPDSSSIPVSTVQTPSGRAGGVTGIAGELLRWGWMPLVSCGCMSVALANHVVEFAYPLADVLTKVPFFGGNYPLALTFTVIFGAVAVVSVIAAFMKHEK